jgi:hypothetical protein
MPDPLEDLSLLAAAALLRMPADSGGLAPRMRRRMPTTDADDGCRRR